MGWRRWGQAATIARRQLRLGWMRWRQATRRQLLRHDLLESLIIRLAIVVMGVKSHREQEEELVLGIIPYSSTKQ